VRRAGHGRLSEHFYYAAKMAEVGHAQRQNDAKATPRAKVGIPAKAGTHRPARELVERWIPAFAGMTDYLRII